MRAFDAALDVFWVVVATREDDQILAATGDVHLCVLDKTEITGAEKATFEASERAKHALVLFGLIPIALGDRGTLDPELPDLPWLAFAERLAVDDLDSQTRGDHATARDDRGIACVL